MRWWWGLLLALAMVGCAQAEEENPGTISPALPSSTPDGPYLVVLGVAQDAGYPQAGCNKSCCGDAWSSGARQSPVALGLVDSKNQRKYLFEATPDLPRQLARLNGHLDSGNGHLPHGIFLTHAHIGHYTGLMYLGREVQGASQVPVFVLPRMADFLRQNGPWSQLVELENISLHPQTSDSSQSLTPQLAVTPFLVPHRDEFSETVGYRIEGPQKTALFIPDIDKWERWELELAEVLEEVDYALVDATFFENGELPGRDMAEIPHPFVVETMDLLRPLPVAERAKVYFIHFNHTNPLARQDATARQRVLDQGFHVAEEGMILPL